MIDPTHIIKAFEAVGYAAVTVLSVLGAGRILENLINRFWSRSDSMQSEQIKSDSIFKQSIVERLAKVEEKFERQADELLAALVENARLQGENNLLVEKLTAATKEQAELEKKLANSNKEKAAFRSKVDALTEKLQDTMTKLAEALERITVLEDALSAEREKNNGK